MSDTKKAAAAKKAVAPKKAAAPKEAAEKKAAAPKVMAHKKPTLEQMCKDLRTSFIKGKDQLQDDMHRDFIRKEVLAAVAAGDVDTTLEGSNLERTINNLLA